MGLHLADKRSLFIQNSININRMSVSTIFELAFFLEDLPFRILRYGYWNMTDELATFVEIMLGFCQVGFDHGLFCTIVMIYSVSLLLFVLCKLFLK
jgi:hypothetical protein